MTSKFKSIFLLVLAISISVSIIIYLEMQPTEKYKIVYVSKCIDESVSFWNNLHLGMEAGAKDYGVELKIIGPQNETDIETQNLKILEAIESNPDAIILSAASFDQQSEYVQKIADKNIPLITVDSNIDSDINESFIGTDNYMAGYTAADSILSLDTPPKNVLIINSSEDASSLKDRERGAIDRLSMEDDVNIIGPFYCSTDTELSYEICKQEFINDPSIDGVIGLNEMAMSGAVKAVDEFSSERKISLVGIDSSESIIKGLEKEIVDKLIVQKPYNMGYLSIKAAVDVLEGNEVEPFIDTGFQIVDKENMYTNENQKLLFIFAE